MRYVHPDQMTKAERQRLTREAALSVARLRLLHADKNPKAIVEDARRVIKRFAEEA
jgi:hypothetical protein